MDFYDRMLDVSPVLPDYRIIHRKDGVYDLYDNLLEKYRRGQKDFSEEEFEKLTNFVSKALGRDL